VHLGDGAGHVRYIEQHLGAGHRVEAIFEFRQVFHALRLELDLGQVGAAAHREGQHGRAGIDAHHPSRGSDQRRHVVRQEPGAAAHVQHPLARAKPEGLEGPQALAGDVRRLIEAVGFPGFGLVVFDHGQSPGPVISRKPEVAGS
jgi:hypothetical protein